MFEGARPALLKESIMDGVLQAGHGIHASRRRRPLCTVDQLHSEHYDKRGDYASSNTA